MAMYLAKELTNRSLPEIGHQFGGKDHTTVLHACRRVKELIKRDSQINERSFKFNSNINELMCINC